MAAPETPSTVTTSPEDAVKIELKKATTDTSADLQKLKDQLKSDHSITNENDPTIKAEMEELTKFFEGKKNEIKFITKGELKQLAEAMKDTAASGQAEKLEWALDVNADGGLVFNETKTESATAAPEAPKPAEPTSPEIAAAVAFFKEEGEFVETNTAPKETLGSRIGKYIMDAWNGLVIAFKEMIWQDVSNEKAQLEWYKDALSKKKVEWMVSGLIPYMGWSLDKASVAKKEWLAKHIEWTGVPLVYTSENGNQQIMIAPQVMKYVFEWKGGEKLQNILKNNPEAFENIQAVRGKYLSLDNGASIADISATDRVKEIFTVEEDRKGDYIQLANDQANISESSDTILPIIPIEWIAPVESGPVTPEAQANKLNEAQKADRDLEEAKRISPETEDSKKKVVEAQSKVDEIKNRERDLILGILSETEKTLNDLKNQEKALNARNDTVPPELTKKIAAYTTNVENIKDNILGKKAMNGKPEIPAIGELDPSANTYKLKPGIWAESILTASIAIQSIKDKLNPAISTELNSEKEKTEKGKIRQISNQLSVIFIVPPSIIKDAQKLVDSYKENPSFNEEIALLNKNLDTAKAKIDLVIIAVRKKQQMANENRFIKWNNEDTDIHRGWVEIDGKEDADGSYLEFDADGYFEVDWQLIRWDSPLVKKLWWLKNCRDILMANKNTIMNTTDLSSLQY